MLFANYIIL